MNDWEQTTRAFDEIIDLPPAERTRRVQALPDSLRDDVAALVEAHDRAGDFLSDLPVADAAPPLAPGDALGAWRIVSLVAEGGMGAVYRAVRNDGQFEMQAAVKVMAAGLVTPETSRRFREERQILASLEHPNIARLLDGGVDARGRPYLVMEFVDGVPITRFIQPLSLTARLTLFRTVCAAVHYAHQRLIVHRDIKPGNVLVTSDGTAKLVDFGIARTLEASGAVSWFQPLTPGYASPEQLRGDPVSTASDVWSLGALLYEVLAGRPPFHLPHAAVTEALAAVEQSVPAPPTHDPDLASIVARAMASEPAARYGSPADLGADLARWQRGEPVDARPRTWRYVAGKYLTRHRLGAALAAAALLAIGITTAAALWQARAATRARALAERRFADVRELAGTMIFGVHDRIADLPGSSAARRFLVESGLTYLDRLSAETDGDQPLERQLAASYLRLGEVLGLPSGFNLGDTSGALAAFTKAETLAQRLVDRAGPAATAEDVRRLAAIHDRFAQVYLGQRRPEAIARARAAIDTLARLPIDVSDTRSQLTIAAAHYMLANTTRTLGSDPAIEQWQASLAIYDRLLARDPGNDDLRRNAALVHKNLASAYRDYLHDESQAQVHLDAALAIDRARVTASPDSATARLDLSFDLTESAFVLAKQGSVLEAADRYGQAVDLRRALASSDPKDVRARGRLAYAEMRLGQVLARLERPDAARDQYAAAVRDAELVLAATPDAPNTQGDRVSALAGLAVVTHDCRFYDKAAAGAQALGPRAPEWVLIWVKSAGAASGCAR